MENDALTARHWLQRAGLPSKVAFPSKSAKCRSCQSVSGARRHAGWMSPKVDGSRS